MQRDAGRLFAASASLFAAVRRKMEALLKVGIITQTHGIKGEVKVFPTTDDAARFKKLKEVILDNGKEKERSGSRT